MWLNSRCLLRTLVRGFHSWSSSPRVLRFLKNFRLWVISPNEWFLGKAPWRFYGIYLRHLSFLRLLPSPDRLPVFFLTVDDPHFDSFCTALQKTLLPPVLRFTDFLDTGSFPPGPSTILLPFLQLENSYSGLWLIPNTSYDPHCELEPLVRSGFPEIHDVLRNAILELKK